MYRSDAEGKNPVWSNVGNVLYKEGIAIANENITKCKLKDNISILNFDEDTLPEDSTMDVVTLVEVLHEIPRVDRLKVFKTIYKLMKKNGTLVILDETMPVR